jgi:hypothetical protein
MLVSNWRRKILTKPGDIIILLSESECYCFLGKNYVDGITWQFVMGIMHSGTLCSGPFLLLL